MNRLTIYERTSDAIAEFSILRVAAVMVGVAAFAISFCEISLAHSAAFTLATGDTAFYLSCVAAFAAFVKMLWIPCATTMWEKGLVTAAIASVVFGVVTHIYSVQAVLSLAATGRDTVISQRGQDIEKRDRVAQRYDAAKRTVEKLSGQRASAEVEKELRLTQAEVETAKAAKATADSDATAQLSTGAGKRYNESVSISKASMAKIDAGQNRARTLEIERKLSVQAERARADMQVLNAQLDGLVAPGHADPQAAVMTDYLALVGVKATERGVGLASLLPILALVELGGALAMTMASGMWTAGAPVQISRPSGGFAVATYAPETPPMEPVKMLPTPEPSKEQTRLRALTQLIALERTNKINASGNELAEHLCIPASSMHNHLNRWSKDGRITMTRDGDRYVIGLPTRALIAARREMVAA